jgi:hypothetical protein
MWVWWRDEVIWSGFVLVLPLFWALFCLVVCLLPLGLMSGVCTVVFLIHFRYIFYVIPTCPPANDESPKLMKLC